MDDMHVRIYIHNMYYTLNGPDKIFENVGGRHRTNC